MFGLLCSYEACYNLSLPLDKNGQRQCKIKKKGKLLKEIKGQGMSYRIETPKDDSGKYKNNQLCTYNLPQPKKEHVYIYLFPDDSLPSIEKSNNEKS